jgi:SAM-dependent methyltransferase
MYTDILDLREFYAGALGRLARHLIARRLRQIWPDMTGKRVLGIGFATPYLAPFQNEAERILAIMPSAQGVMHWPEGAANLVALADEHVLPLPDRSIDRMILVHCLEGSDHLRQFMRECWRVLADGGRLIVVVANRRGLWARAEGSPFAQGRPYSMSQIIRLLRENLFVPLQTATTLFIPPVWWALFRAWATTLDDLGTRWFPTFAGALIIEAEKQIYAAPFEMAVARARRSKVVVRPANNGVRSNS